MSVFETLNGLNVNGHTETKKSGNTELTYLSWPWAWAEVKKRYPEAHYTIWKDANGKPYAFDPLTGFMVYTTVTIGDESHDMWLPVMDGANNAMKAEPYDYTVKNPAFKWAKYDKKRGGYYDKYGNHQTEYLTKHVNAATMFDVNKAIMRCLVKNLAMFGLGLYIYAGEDLPEGEGADNGAQPEEQPIPRTGSAEAAQEAGQRRLKEIEQQLKEARESAPASPVKSTATDEQIAYIRENADGKTLKSAMEAFGSNLERMTAGQANKLIGRIKGAGAA